MKIAIVYNDVVTAVGDYWNLFPGTSFNTNGPSNEFLAQNNAVRVSVFKPYDRQTEKLVPCDPYLEEGVVYTVQVQPLTEEDNQAIKNSKAAKIRAERDKRLASTDWTQLADAPVDKAVWATYRQALRDITAQEGFPETVNWPASPDDVLPGPTT